MSIIGKVSKTFGMMQTILRSSVKVGDLVALRLCQQAGKIGIITCTRDIGHDGLGFYWVLIDTGNRRFTKNCMVRHKWMENNE
jgi:hypothetical protein